MTIVRGTLPLVLFDTRAYGSMVGRVLMPSFLVSALAPLAYAWVIERYGERLALYLSTAVAGVVLAAAMSLLPLRARRARTR